MRSTGLVNAMLLAFFSKEFYREVGRGWPGLGFAYLLLAVFLTLLPLALSWSIKAGAVTMAWPMDLEYIIQQVPELKIEGGALEVAVEQPYRITEKESGDTIAIIDTTKPVAEYSAGDFNGLVLGKDQMLLHRESESRLYPYPAEPMTVTQADVRSVAQAGVDYLWLLPWLMLPFLVLGSFVYRLIQALVYGGLGMAIAMIFKVDIDYPACVRIASVAITPALVLAMAASLLGVGLPVVLYFLLAMVYVGYGIKANA